MSGTEAPASPPEPHHVDSSDAAQARHRHMAAAIAAADLLNKRNAAHNANLDHASTTTTLAPPPHIQFRSNTIAPSPPQAESPSLSSAATPRRAAAADHPRPEEDASPYQPSPLGSGDGLSASALANSLRISTDVFPAPPLRTDSLNSTSNLSPGRSAGLALQHKSSASSLQPISRTPSLKTTAFATSRGSISAASSTVPSPIITAMGDVTPLPSPLLSGDSPGPWKRLSGRPPSREAPPPLLPGMSESVLVTSTGESIAAALAHQSKRRAYAGLNSGEAPAPGALASGAPSDTHLTLPHARNRSISDYIPDNVVIPKRMATVSSHHAKHSGPHDIDQHFEPSMRREPHLGEARGLTPVQKPPTPPPSESSLTAADSSSSHGSGSSTASRKSRLEYFDVFSHPDGKRRRWRAVKLLGQGTFSRVMLATSQIAPDDDEDTNNANGSNGTLTPEPQSQYNRRTLVAVKVCEHGPRGGASEDRVEMSLKRELEMMRTIHHPSLVQLKAWSIEPTRAILVLSYCPGGDLFDFASAHRDLLSPILLRRIFAELVGAVRYLHERRIVHRDIKLENVLVNLAPAELAGSPTDWQKYPYSVTTLTDLGLSRRIADDERLETRCGSDDYAAPEVIMGQPYDGRATDAWSLGVLLYAMLEARLPFDPHPGASDSMRLRSRTSHRIARVEWRWIEYAGDDGDHEGSAAKFAERGLLGAMRITEGLLKRARSRWPLEKVAAMDWVRDGVAVDGGIRFRDEEQGAEVL